MPAHSIGPCPTCSATRPGRSTARGAGWRSCGPRSPEAYWAVRYADDRLRDLLEAIRASRLADQTTLIVASDHGFFPIDKDIRPNAVFRQEGLLTEKTKLAAAASQGGASMIY